MSGKEPTTKESQLSQVEQPVFVHPFHEGEEDWAPEYGTFATCTVCGEGLTKKQHFEDEPERCPAKVGVE